MMIDTIVEKTQTCQFYILYDNINVYKYTHSQKTHNQSNLVNYIVGYIFCMKILRSTNNSDNIQAKSYSDNNQINQKFINKQSLNEFELNIDDENYQSAAVCYIISEILGQFFFATINKK